MALSQTISVINIDWVGRNFVIVDGYNVDREGQNDDDPSKTFENNTCHALASSSTSLLAGMKDEGHQSNRNDIIGSDGDVRRADEVRKWCLGTTVQQQVQYILLLYCRIPVAVPGEFAQVKFPLCSFVRMLSTGSFVDLPLLVRPLVQAISSHLSHLHTKSNAL